jgi:hypothetical protein
VVSSLIFFLFLPFSSSPISLLSFLICFLFLAEGCVKVMQL